jgi:hypothetical protein
MPQQQSMMMPQPNMPQMQPNSQPQNFLPQPMQNVSQNRDTSALTRNPNAGMIPTSGGGDVAQPPEDVAGQAITDQNSLYDLLFTELTIPIMPMEKDHLQKAEWFRDFLDTHEGLNLGREQREICFEFVLKHQQMDSIARNGMLAMDQMTQGAMNLPGQAMQAKLGQMAQGPQPPPGQAGSQAGQGTPGQ